ncbi:MAG TPA: zinc-ribbon domain-containing protein [Anaerolineae bacterium]|nr:zinc-ribbon domain-containing protein [Anaerolineae bacterium]
MTLFCPNCGAAQPQGATRCANCGQAMPLPAMENAEYARHMFQYTILPLLVVVAVMCIGGLLCTSFLR